MSLDYYLFSRNAYRKIVEDLKNIISNYEEIINYNKFQEENIIDNPFNKNFFVWSLEHFQYIFNKCNLKIMKLCKHEIIDDSIDITPDRSQNIRYCQICENSEEDINRSLSI